MLHGREPMHEMKRLDAVGAEEEDGEGERGGGGGGRGGRMGW